jgi:hypothetical protein
MLRALLPLLLLPIQDKGLRKPEFRLPPGRVAEYVPLDRAGKPAGEPPLLLLGSELSPTSNRFVVDRLADLPLVFLFQLPPKAFKGSSAWEFTTDFFVESQDAAGAFAAFLGGGGLRPLHVRGRYAVKGVQKKEGEEILLIDGSFTFFEIRQTAVNNQPGLAVTKNDLGTLATSIQFGMDRGLPLRAGWQLKLKGQEREGPRLADRKIEAQGLISLKEVRDLDAEALRAAASRASERAVERLQALLRPDGAWTPPGNVVHPDETLAATALAVEALLAAGLPAADPALTSASRVLMGNAPEGNAALARQLLALSRRQGDPREKAHALRLGEELLRRRDGVGGGWSADGRNPALNLSTTAVALEALAACPDLKVPEEVWDRAFKWLLAAMRDEGEEVDLDLEFRGDAPFRTDPRKVLPAGWPPPVPGAAGDPIRAMLPQGRRRGTAISAAEALRSLALCASKLDLDEAGRQGLEDARRRGFGGLQRRWTLRTVPPPEGGWSAQRLEYLGLIGPLLAGHGIERIAGSEWRSEALLLLLEEQGPDGSWHAGTPSAASKTAHALLFISAAAR